MQNFVLKPCLSYSCGSFRGKEDFNIDCMDPLGRTALSIAIINENPGTKHINQWKWTIAGNQPMEMDYPRKSTNKNGLSQDINQWKYCLSIGSRFIAKISIILPKPRTRSLQFIKTYACMYQCLWYRPS